ncbi:MAG: Mur ligase family protein [Marinilabiliales bacterium]|nr:Mur ligase family protein [Marinilabiliales bacterium]
MMELEKILTGINVVSFSGDRKTNIENIVFDSRKVTAGSLFVAVKGSKSDGHDFIDKCSQHQEHLLSFAKYFLKNRIKMYAWIKTADSAKALGQAASNFFGNPSSSLKLVGVTGTNGKTTIATLLYRMFTRLGYKCGLFSTVCNYIVGKRASCNTYNTRSCSA